MHPFIKITTGNENRPTLQWLQDSSAGHLSRPHFFARVALTFQFSIHLSAIIVSLHFNLFASVTPCHPVAFICDHSKYSLSPKCSTLVDACHLLSRVAIPVHATVLHLFHIFLYGLWCGGDLLLHGLQLRFLCSSLLSRVHNTMRCQMWPFRNNSTVSWSVLL